MQRLVITLLACAVATTRLHSPVQAAYGVSSPRRAK